MSYLGRKSGRAALISDDIPNDSITGAKIVDDAIDSEHYAAGSVDAVHVAADVATQAELDLKPTQAELDAIRQDITILALREAISENRTTLNLPNSLVETFEDNTGMTLTDVTRDDTSEFVATTDTSAWGSDTQFRTTDLDSSKFLNGAAVGLTNDMTVSPTDVDELIDGTEAAGAYGIYTQAPSGFNVGFGYNIKDTSGFSAGNFKLTRVRFWSVSTNARPYDFKVQVHSASNPSGGTWDSPTLTNTDNATADSGVFVVASNADDWQGASFTGVAANYWRISLDGYYNNGNTAAGIGEVEFWGQKYTAAINAAGTLISAANAVASAKTKVSGVMLYKDAYGTATIGTDLEIYFTCNGGTNWTEAASYTAVTPVFSTGIKMVKLGETTCTSGSDVRYKAVWANQVASVKSTQLHGIGLNY